MTNERDALERLRAADPARGASYQHADVDALLSRVMTAAAPSNSARFAKGFRLKMASAAMSAALVTGAGIAALSTSSSTLPVLAIGGASHLVHSKIDGANAPASVKATAPYEGVVAPGGGSMMRIFANYQFQGPDLSSTPLQASAVPLLAPSNPAGRAAVLAALFGCPTQASSAPLTPGPGTFLTFTNGAGGQFTYAYGGATPATWSYQSPSSATVVSFSTVSSPATATVAVNVATALLAQINPSVAVGTPTSSVFQDIDNQGANFYVTYVSLPIVVNGLTTDLSVDFYVNGDNVVTAANGTDFVFGTTVKYPLVAPSDGVAMLQAQNPPIVQSSPAPGSGDVPTTLAVPVISVTLTNPTVAYQTYDLTDGTVWLLPAYNYSSTAVTEQGTTSNSTWTLLAVDPTYVNVAHSTHPIAY